MKTDRIDAVVLAKLHAAGFLPQVWQPDETTERLRRHVARRAVIVEARTRLKNRIHAVPSANLLPACNGDVFSGRGRARLARQPIEGDERQAIEGWLAEPGRLGAELARSSDRALAEAGLAERHACAA